MLWLVNPMSFFKLIHIFVLRQPTKNAPDFYWTTQILAERA